MSDSLQVNNDVKNAVKYATGLDYESNANTAAVLQLQSVLKKVSEQASQFFVTKKVI